MNHSVNFWLGAPDPQRGTLSPGCVGGFCRPSKVPTSGVNSAAKFCTVFEIFGVKVLPFSPHSVTTDEVSAPQQCHMVGVVGGYNVLYGRDPSLLVGPVRDARSFGRIGPREKCMNRLLYRARPRYKKKRRRSRDNKLLHTQRDRSRCVITYVVNSPEVLAVL